MRTRSSLTALAAIALVATAAAPAHAEFYSIDDPENVKTFDWLKSELVGEDLVGPVAPRSLNRADAFEAFTEGDVGMLNGHPTLMKAAEDKGVKFGMVPMPGEDGPTRISMGVADWMMAFKQNGHAEEAGDFLDFVYEDENVLEFSRRYDLLPVTMPVWDVMSEAKEDAHLKPFLEALPTSELYPVGRTSWAAVNAEIKKKIGGAVAYGGDPATVQFDELLHQRETDAQSARPPRGRGIGLAEAVEHARQKFRGYARTIVGNRQIQV